MTGCVSILSQCRSIVLSVSGQHGFLCMPQAQHALHITCFAEASAYRIQCVHTVNGFGTPCA